jgi:hypothetical protein
VFVNPALLSQAGMDLRSAGGSWRTDEFVFIASEQNRFEEELTRRGKRLLLLSGDHDARFRAAVAACDALLAEVRPLE